MLAQLAADSRLTARGPRTLHVKEAISDVQLLQSNSAARTIEAPRTKYTGLVLLQFSTFFFDETVEFVEEFAIVFADGVNDTGQHRFDTGSAADE